MSLTIKQSMRTGLTALVVLLDEDVSKGTILDVGRLGLTMKIGEKLVFLPWTSIISVTYDEEPETTTKEP